MNNTNPSCYKYEESLLQLILYYLINGKIERRLNMPSASTIRKAKLTVTISGDVVNEIDEIAKEKGTPRSQVMEEMLRDWLLKSKKKMI
ncbi:MAG: hypothetical protein DCC43_13110 [Candidatus Brocadia sp.]|nr:CopG family transcriptional regulator [Candidatus Brocadia sp. AMX3]MDG5997147.1 CopG family transcriptional regulator [Candidatus Brocadia sp.]RIJ93497.1 MAG: hypothetical protein DCC43_13110 [Candidatus Brocadia sp.]